jgi:hypothetical protein
METTSQSREIDLLRGIMMVGAFNLTVQVEVDVLLVHGGRAPAASKIEQKNK